ncbi:hypothetical protein ACAG26_07775 [Mycobacterium sp. pUA109]|uniref:hypothetical protein n=1 Tax=Mycobacterium sp. pUA109 TaxID=3238982 RepID=UPI00351AEEB0
MSERLTEAATDHVADGSPDRCTPHGQPELFGVKAVAVSLAHLQTLDCGFLHAGDDDFPDQPLHHGSGQRGGEFRGNLLDQRRNDLPDRSHRDRLDHGYLGQRRAERLGCLGERQCDFKCGDRQGRENLDLGVLDFGATVLGEFTGRVHRLGEFVHRIFAVEQHGKLFIDGMRCLPKQHRRGFRAHPVQIRD